MGFIYAFICAVLLTTKDTVSKKLSFNVSSTSSAFGSFFFALPGYFILISVLYFLGYENFNFSYKFFIFVLARSLTDTAAEWLKMKAFSLGDLSLVSCFVSLTPLFLLITSPLITGDKIPTAAIFAVILVMIGSLLLVYRPKKAGNSKNNLPAILVATASAFMFSLNACFDRLAVSNANASPVLSGLCMTALSACFISPFVIYQKASLSELRTNIKPFLIRGLVETFFMVTKLSALQYLQAPYVAAIQKSSLVLSVISGRLIYKEEDFKKRIVAALIILLGIFLLLKIIY